MQKAVISGVGPDRPGIVAGLTGVLFRHGCNIVDSSMTILEREFTMILIVSLPDGVTVADLQGDFSKVEKELGLALFIKDLEEPPPVQRPSEEPIPYMISVSGRDRTGITHRVSRILAEEGINITDLNAQTIAGEDGPVYIMMVEVEVPGSLGLEPLHRTMGALEREMDLEIGMQPIEPVML